MVDVKTSKTLKNFVFQGFFNIHQKSTIKPQPFFSAEYVVNILE
jgi:hypothetical protein